MEYRIKNTGGFITQVGNFAFVKSPESYNNLLAMKKSAAGAAEFKSLASSLDSATGGTGRFSASLDLLQYARGRKDLWAASRSRFRGYEK